MFCALLLTERFRPGLLGGTAVFGVLESNTSDVALRLGPRATPPAAAAGATLTVTQYREQFAMPPLLHAIQRGSLGRIALAPLVRAVHVPDGLSTQLCRSLPLSPRVALTRVDCSSLLFSSLQRREPRCSADRTSFGARTARPERPRAGRSRSSATECPTAPQNSTSYSTTHAVCEKIRTRMYCTVL